MTTQRVIDLSDSDAELVQGLTARLEEAQRDLKIRFEGIHQGIEIARQTLLTEFARRATTKENANGEQRSENAAPATPAA